MILRTLTRLPSSGFEGDLLTGVPVVDDYLKRLDAELVGRASLRRATLEEVRDHLLEQHSALVDRGLAPDQAARQAVEGFGSEKDLGAEQRRETTANFFRNLVQFGLGFALFMTLFALFTNQHQPAWLLAAMFMFHFLFFGFFMSLTMTFGTPRLRLTESLVSESSETPPTVHVYTPKNTRNIALGMSILGLAYLLVCIPGAMGFGIAKELGLLGNLLLSYAGAGVMIAMAHAWTRISFDGTQLEIKNPLNNRRFQVHGVTKFAAIPGWKAYLLLKFGRSHELSLVTDQGETQTLYLTLSGEQYNSDQLIALLESKKASSEHLLTRQC